MDIAKSTIKQLVEKRDSKGIMYVFLDSLDVDPTFKKYEEDLKYVLKNFPKAFQKHEDLHPLLSDESKWDDKYWEIIKLDLIKNFSLKRLNHMRRVAKVVYAEKIGRLLKEREATSLTNKKKETQSDKRKDPNTNGSLKITENRKKFLQLIMNKKFSDADQLASKDPTIFNPEASNINENLLNLSNAKEIRYDDSYLKLIFDQFSRTFDKRFYQRYKEVYHKIQAYETEKDDKNEKIRNSSNEFQKSKVNPTKFQKVKAKLIELFSSLISKIQRLINTFKDSKFKRLLLKALGKAKSGLSKSKSLNIVNIDLANSLKKEAEDINNQLKNIQSNESYNCCESFCEFCYSYNYY